MQENLTIKPGEGRRFLYPYRCNECSKYFFYVLFFDKKKSD